jgi:hypothetical protein
VVLTNIDSGIDDFGVGLGAGEIEVGRAVEQALRVDWGKLVDDAVGTAVDVAGDRYVGGGSDGEDGGTAAGAEVEVAGDEERGVLDVDVGRTADAAAAEDGELSRPRIAGSEQFADLPARSRPGYRDRRTRCARLRGDNPICIRNEGAPLINEKIGVLVRANGNAASR